MSDIMGGWVAVRDERDRLLCENALCRSKIAELEAAIKKHHSQKADDRCWMDDAKLYAAAGLPMPDFYIESPSAMLENCKRFIELRMCGQEGSWKSYAELEARIAELESKLTNIRRYVGV